MSGNQKYTAIILKKQAFGEADEIITFFTRESGKVRGLAKSVKLSKSKLQNSLQCLFVVNLTLAGRGQLPKVIAAEVTESFFSLRLKLEVLKHAFYANELALKFTADGQKNEKLFDLLLGFLKFLETNGRNLELALAKFKTDFLSASGWSASYHQGLARQPKHLDLCLSLENASFNEIGNRKNFGEVAALQKFLSEFIAYHLEREVKSEKFLNSSMI
ncbi:MAG: DNA repair protein RecO [Candidatus Doudnabacteria bacterium]|nr:DNA repair protein RecO [Candidatus Doudnabacteria bacterium]